MIVDKGGMGVDRSYGRDFTLPDVAEKGHLVRRSLIRLDIRVDVIYAQNVGIGIDMIRGQ